MLGRRKMWVALLLVELVLLVAWFLKGNPKERHIFFGGHQRNATCVCSCVCWVDPQKDHTHIRAVCGFKRKAKGRPRPFFWITQKHGAMVIRQAETSIAEDGSQRSGFCVSSTFRVDGDPFAQKTAALRAISVGAFCEYSPWWV